MRYFLAKSILNCKKRMRLLQVRSDKARIALIYLFGSVFGRGIKYITLFSLLLTSCQSPQQKAVIIIGGGASGTMAGIQSARMGVSTLIVEETPWLGGMLTAAGVSAVDGNYELESGLWAEFKQLLNAHYGGPDQLKTGWVSNVMFEPHTGAKILSALAAKEPNLEVWHGSTLMDITRVGEEWLLTIDREGTKVEVAAQVVIDGTELGDVAQAVGIPYEMGMDARDVTGEDIAPEVANDIIQDLTYVAVLKDYGPGADKTISRPADYDPAPFRCTCEGQCNEQESLGRALWPCDKMMEYGKLPNGYYMINWPLFGNDYYVNAIELTEKERQQAFEKARRFTRHYIYYLQEELGYRHLGIADDVFPTEDGLPMIPYHRESRRIKGIVTFDINDLARPFDQKQALYRTGIAVGDYPVDHHHHAHPDFQALPDLHFYPVPSYSVPLGALIPDETSHFIVAEKSISVTNLVNGTTRLQPVCILIGQAAGSLAALSVQLNTAPEYVPVRKVQQALLDHQAYLLPYSDMMPESRGFLAIQRIGATGILRGEGKNIGWRNHTHFHPDSLVTGEALSLGLDDWPGPNVDDLTAGPVAYDDLSKVCVALSRNYNPKNILNTEILAQLIREHNLSFVEGQYLSRRDFAILLDAAVNPFGVRPIDHFGNFID